MPRDEMTSDSSDGVRDFEMHNFTSESQDTSPMDKSFPFARLLGARRELRNVKRLTNFW